MGSGLNYLWCLMPGKGILKGRGKKNHFTMSSRNSGSQFDGVQFLSLPPCYCCFPLSSWSLQPERRFLSSGFVSLGNSAFVSKVTSLGQWNTEAESTFVREWMKRDPSCHWSREHSFSLKFVKRNLQISLFKPVEPIKLNQHTSTFKMVQWKSHFDCFDSLTRYCKPPVKL